MSFEIQNFFQREKESIVCHGLDHMEMFTIVKTAISSLRILNVLYDVCCIIQQPLLEISSLKVLIIQLT